MSTTRGNKIDTASLVLNAGSSTLKYALYDATGAALQRGKLEQGMLFGRHRRDKNDRGGAGQSG